MLPVEQVAHNGWAAVVVFFALLIAHAVGDFALQGSFLSQAKSRHAELEHFFSDGAPRSLWWNALLAHALIHAGAVWLVTGYVALAVVELLLHFAIDYSKCEGWISFATDQTIHRLCKVFYVVLLYLNWPSFLDWSPFPA